MCVSCGAMANQCRRWCFTFNNYTEETIDYLRKWLTEDVCCYAIVGKEVGSVKHTPHLQGFMNLKRKVRIATLKKKLNAHYESARGSDEENRNYCKKGGDVILEVGKPAEKIGTTNVYICAKELADKVAAGEDLNNLLDNDERYVAAYARYSGFVDKCVEAKREKIGKERFDRKYGSMSLVLYEWQVELYDMLTKEEPQRHSQVFQSTSAIALLHHRGNSQTRGM